MEVKLMKVVKFYADIQVGTVGKVAKIWSDPNGCKWVKLIFGKNISGQLLKRVIPFDCLEVI